MFNFFILFLSIIFWENNVVFVIILAYGDFVPYIFFLRGDFLLINVRLVNLVWNFIILVLNICFKLLSIIAW